MLATFLFVTFVIVGNYFLSPTKPSAKAPAKISTPAATAIATLPDPWTLPAEDGIADPWEAPSAPAQPEAARPMLALPAAPTAADLDALKATQLKELAKGRIKGYSKMRKAQLAEALAAHLSWTDLRAIAG